MLTGLGYSLDRPIGIGPIIRTTDQYPTFCPEIGSANHAAYSRLLVRRCLPVETCCDPHRAIAPLSPGPIRAAFGARAGMSPIPLGNHAKWNDVELTCRHRSQTGLLAWLVRDLSHHSRFHTLSCSLRDWACSIPFTRMEDHHEDERAHWRRAAPEHSR